MMLSPAEEHKLRRCEAMRERRANQTTDEKAVVNLIEAERKRNFRLQQTPETRTSANLASAEAMRNLRADQTSDERTSANLASAEAMRNLRADQTPDERTSANMASAESMRILRASRRNNKEAGVGDGSFGYAFRRLPKYKTLLQEWSITCEFCQCVHLKSTTASFRKKCCMGGQALDPSKMPQVHNFYFTC
jgi:hypothetical protein